MSPLTHPQQHPYLPSSSLAAFLLPYDHVERLTATKARTTQIVTLRTPTEFSSFDSSRLFDKNLFQVANLDLIGYFTIIAAVNGIYLHHNQGK
jgi:hypothetical protein